MTTIHNRGAGSWYRRAMRAVTLATVATVVSIGFLGAMTAASAEVTVVVFKETAGLTPSVYTFADDAEYKAKGLDAGSHVALSADDLTKLQGGETMLISERMPLIAELPSAWGLAFAKVEPQALFDLHSDYDNWTKYFEDVLSIKSWKNDQGEARVVYQLKKSSVNVEMTLLYTNVLGVSKEWKLLTSETTTLPGYTAEQMTEIQSYVGKNDFAVNQGGWFFVPVPEGKFGEHKTIIVRGLAVKLAGIKNMIKGSARIKADTEAEMPATISKLVTLAEQRAAGQ